MKPTADIEFYDTSSLLLIGEKLFENEEKFIISSITLQELENIKNSSNKSPEIKYGARLILRLLNENPNKYDVVAHKESREAIISNAGFAINNDTKILSDVIWYNNIVAIDRVIFVTNDLSLKVIANHFLGNEMIKSIEEEEDNYTGYMDLIPTEQEIEVLYTSPEENIFNALPGQYLILRNQENKIIDLRAWDGDRYRYLNDAAFNTRFFGQIGPIKNDIYQRMVCDSFRNNTITMVKGPAGTGKTYLSLGFLMYALEKGQIDKIIVFCNTVATANSARLGFYPGDRNSKLMDSQIGNLLASKLGGQEGVMRLIEEGKLVLLPMSDIRGYDTSGMKAGIYISEAQNLDRTLMKLALQRIGNDSICIIDGDSKAQVDDIHFAGINNGMRRASKVFRGTPVYGEIELCTNYRSQIASIAEKI